MARRGRTRKAGKREPNGKPQRDSASVRREADRIDPTPEMARKKRAVDGAEVGDPLAYVSLTNPQREALARYCSLRRAAGWGVRRITAQYDDPMFLGGEEGTNREEREERIKAFYESCDAALLTAGSGPHRAVCNLFSFRAVMGSLDELRQGANVLAAFFGLERSEAA